MRLTSKTAYGVQALYDMAFHGAGRPVQAREVADRQQIPLRYLEQILQELRRAGLVEGKRGPGGGYALARRPQEVRLAEVVAALDGPLDSLVSLDGPAAGGGRGRR
jgi:Rrf2 family iron-sulfur cluster assembly transcriptional regulator